MQTLIKEILDSGNAVTIHLTTQAEPIFATFVKSTDSAMLLRTASGYSIVRADAIYRIEVSADASHTTTDANGTTITGATAEPGNETSGTPSRTPDETIYEPADSESFTPIFTPKVVGRIDLSAINDPRRKRPYGTPAPATDNPVVPAGGTIMSIGPAFGFITASDGESLFFSRAEVMQRNSSDLLYKGMPVVFTPGRNAKGGVARCVHAQMTMQEQLEWIEKIERYDPRNARMMAEQLMLAFPDDAELADTLGAFSSRPYQPSNSYSRIGVPIADKVLADVEQGHYIEPADLLKAEKEIAATKPYEEAFSQISQLLNHAKTNYRQQCYQIYVRLIKLARNHGDTDRAFDTIDNAIGFYADETGARTYFEGLRRKTEADTTEQHSEDNGSDNEAAGCGTDLSQQVCDKIMSSAKANAVISSERSELLQFNINAIHDNLNSLAECICGRMDTAGIEVDSAFERRFYYAVLRSLSDAVAAKFDTEFPMPAEERFLGENVSEFSAMAELTAAVRNLRSLLDNRPDSDHGGILHVAVLATNFSEVAALTDSGKLGENFMRHLKAVAETPGVNLQLVATGSPELADFVRRHQNSFKTFSSYTIA